MKTKKILVIDDDQDLLNAIKFILKNQELEVLTALDGISGLKLLDDHDDIQVVIVDLAMSELSGVELLETIKDRRQPLQRIVLTAYDEELPFIKAKYLKVSAYLNKPVTKQSLLFTIKSAFDDLYSEKFEKERYLKRQFKEIEMMTTDFALWVKNKLNLIPNHLDLIQEKIQNLSLYSSGAIQEEIKNFSSYSTEKFKKIKKIVDEVINVKTALLKPFDETKSETVSVDDIIDKVIDPEKSKGIKIKKYCKPKDLKVNFNKIELKKVIEELIQNALKAMEVSPKKQLDIAAFEESNDKIVIKIKDYGAGIMKEDEDKIFRAFYSDKNKKGNGIGLFTVKNILAKFGGTIEFTSKPGEGTEFTINLKKRI